MSTDQATIFAILVALFVLFVWGRWRYDIVAFLALLAAVVAGVVPFAGAFRGFGHPATVTVALVLVMSRALMNSGAVDLIARHVRLSAKRLSLHIGALSSLGASLSAVMNNVGALALLMPVAIQAAAKAKQSPAVVLMPLSFGTILGGLVTMIGTPPNIIIATFRDKTAGEPFGMFDFTPVGAAVAIVGLVFVAFVGWRLIPPSRRKKLSPAELFDLEDYVSEARVPEGSDAVGLTVHEIEELTRDVDAVIVGVIRKGRRGFGVARREPIEVGDLLVIEAGPQSIDAFITQLKLEVVGVEGSKAKLLRTDDVVLMEAVVPRRSRIERRTASAVRLRSRYGVNLVAVSRQGAPIRERLGTLTLKAGDVLLLQGDSERLPEVIAAIGCLPLAERGLQIGKGGQAWLCAGIFAAAIAAAAAGLAPFPITLSLAVVAVALLKIVPPREIYESVDWPVILLLGAMIPVGEALETTGATGLIAGAIVDLAAGIPPVAILVVLMVVTMTLSDIMNNAATAVVTAPIAVGIAGQLGLDPDPFLMTVAVGASCAFLTPIGHQNNMLIMGPGGYHFGDYWRMGLPLEVLIVAVSIPMIVWVWPL
ncbi:MAG: SLC13 family permease [Proteobacteria bacterium]|nr:SLC13 family permease [Pseudomonadota bacterium]